MDPGQTEGKMYTVKAKLRGGGLLLLLKGKNT
jgi:hypothetical protein